MDGNGRRLSRPFGIRNSSSGAAPNVGNVGLLSHVPPGQGSAVGLFFRHEVVPVAQGVAEVAVVLGEQGGGLWTEGFGWACKQLGGNFGEEVGGGGALQKGGQATGTVGGDDEPAGGAGAPTEPEPSERVQLFGAVEEEDVAGAEGGEDALG